MVAESRKRLARCVEPTVEAQEKWAATIRRKAAALHDFHAECTPGYYNNEGMPRLHSESYGEGPVAFHDLLRRWRAGDGMNDVMVEAR
ncbi:hypothetical protein QFZ58_000753 [Streptomyces sp. B1I3]|nr:hypothetical protein [Streptomyces sp. B1I3]